MLKLKFFHGLRHARIDQCHIRRDEINRSLIIGFVKCRQQRRACWAHTCVCVNALWPYATVLYP
jgi:hypothetical protein